MIPKNTERNNLTNYQTISFPLILKQLTLIVLSKLFWPHDNSFHFTTNPTVFFISLIKTLSV